MPRGFDDVPGSLPPDAIPQEFDPSTVPFVELTEQVLGNFSGSAVDDGCLWRDFLCMTGQIKTVHGGDKIKEEWAGYSKEKLPRNFQAGEPRVTRPAPKSSWVDVPFTFIARQEGGLVGNCSGTISFVPSNDGPGWKVWMLRTLLENFEGCGHPDDPSPIFSTANIISGPGQLEHHVSVLIIGGGQAGLSLSGRLGALSIPYILLEKNSEIGYSWTGKYNGLKQHTVREMNNLPFDRTYKPSDPMLLPAKLVAEGFQNYVKKYHINIWLAAEVENCLPCHGEIGWVLNVRRGGERYLIKARHLVLSMGAALSVPDPPRIPNADCFKGTILDLGNFRNSSSWKGKKGIVVGSATGGHDVAQDMLDNGLTSITMLQRGETPVFPIEWIVKGQSSLYNLQTPPEVADRRVDTLPLKIAREVQRINVKSAKEAEKERFNDLERVGFRVDRDANLNDGIIFRGGGFYIDIGTSSRIANGEIRIKSGDPIKRFVENGLEFESGDILDADVVVFATGYQRDPRIQAATVIGEEIAKSMRTSKGLDKDGELDGNMMPVGKALWLLGGAVNHARWNSRFIALQIQAELKGRPFPQCRWGESGAGYAKKTKL